MNSSTEQKARIIFDRVLPEIKPTHDEIRQTTANINKIMRRLKLIVPNDVELRVTGSVSKSTNLKGGGDIDIFMLFKRDTKRDKLTKLGLEYGKKLAESDKRDHYEIKYAEHPYVRVFLDSLGIKADLVPALKIDNIEDLATAVDRTPLHTAFINDSLTERQRDETRLLKYLLKVNNIYGAEVKTSGFAGYLCEILIYHYGSLFKLLEAAGRFTSPTVLNPKKRTYTNDLETAKQFNSNFVVIDPVDPNRNVAAGVSTEAFGAFVLLARRFVEKPEIKAFYSKSVSKATARSELSAILKRNGLESFMLVTRVPDKSEDTVWPQLRKSADMLRDYLSRFGFSTYLSVQWVEKEEGVILMLAQPQQLTSRLFKGPEFLNAKATGSFMKGHGKAEGFVIIGDSVHALDKNKYLGIKEAIGGALKERVLERGKDVGFRKTKLLVNKIPGDYAYQAYLEISKRLRI